MDTLNFGRCRECGILVDFELRFNKNGWLNPSANKRLARCPRCDSAIVEGEDTLKLTMQNGVIVEVGE